ncbi:MAG: hypothetical protein HS115_12015 [Spirochaetales bacterium]|nr:hypothetical protein [Spirochaetales bacterium]
MSIAEFSLGKEFSGRADFFPAIIEGKMQSRQPEIPPSEKSAGTQFQKGRKESGRKNVRPCCLASRGFLLPERDLLSSKASEFGFRKISSGHQLLNEKNLAQKRKTMLSCFARVSCPERYLPSSHIPFSLPTEAEYWKFKDFGIKCLERKAVEPWSIVS